MRGRGIKNGLKKSPVKIDLEDSSHNSFEGNELSHERMEKAENIIATGGSRYGKP